MHGVPFNKVLFSIFIAATIQVSATNHKKNLAACDTALAGADQDLCADSSMLSANTPAMGTGAWTLISGSGVIQNAGAPNSTVNNLGAGANTFVWTISGGGCPTVTDTVVLTYYLPPTIAVAGADQQICDDSTSITANTPATGTGAWAVSVGSATIASPSSPSTTVTLLGPGQNVIRWKISNGPCASEDSISITVDIPPTAAIAGPDTTICDTVFFLAGNTPAWGSGQWTLISGSANIVNPLNSGTTVNAMNYGSTASFAWTTSNGSCAPTSDTVSITIDIPPTEASAGNDQTVCSPFTALAANTPTSGSGNWTIASGNATISDTSSASITLTAIGAGTNSFVWTIKNGVCAPSSDTILVINQQNTQPNAGSNDTICALSDTLNANTPITGNGSWSLSSGSGSILFTSSPSTLVSNLGTGPNAFVWTISNGICPTLTDTVIIFVYAPSTTANAGADVSVCGSSAVLNASNAVNGVGTWNVILGSGTFSNQNSGSTTVSALAAGQNTLTWTIVNGNCPASSDTVLVTSLTAPPLADAGTDTTICADSTLLSANNTGGYWAVTNGSGILADSSDANTAVTNLSVGTNAFLWTIMYTGCPATSDTVKIFVDAMPDTANAGPDITTNETEVQLAANTPIVGTGLWTNLSDEGNISDPSSAQSIFSMSKSGEFYLVWSISNGVCPYSLDTLYIKTEIVEIPEIITPNGDGNNDKFVIRSLQLTSGIHLTVYNRWGDIVYENENYQHDFEGLNASGKELEEDTYFYAVSANGIEKFKGYLLIKRK